jgi:hypothetical protein
MVKHHTHGLFLMIPTANIVLAYIFHLLEAGIMHTDCYSTF